MNVELPSRNRPRLSPSPQSMPPTPRDSTAPRETIYVPDSDEEMIRETPETITLTDSGDEVEEKVGVSRVPLISICRTFHPTSTVPSSTRLSSSSFPNLASLISRFSRASTYRSLPLSSWNSSKFLSTRLPILAAPSHSPASTSGSVTPRKRPFSNSASSDSAGMATPSTSSSSTPLISIPDKVGDFKLVTKQDLDFATGVQLAKWESESTGLKVVWSGVEGESNSTLTMTAR